MNILKHVLYFSIALTLVSACNQPGPQPFAIGKDACDFCKMTIMEKTSGMELITEKGKLFKFDDISCGVKYHKKNASTGNKLYVSDRISGNFILADKASYLKSESIRTPMGSNIAAFLNGDAAKKYERKAKGKLMTWDEVMALY